MGKKLDNLSVDILSLLEKNRTIGLLWREIVDTLFPDYERKHPQSGRKGFGVVVSYRLKKLAEAGRIRRKGALYFTPLAAQEISKVVIPYEHTLDIVSGVRALRGEGRYRVTGNDTYAKEKFMEPAIQHIRTGFPGMYKRLEELATLKTKLKEDENNKGYSEKYREAYGSFLKEADALAIGLRAKTESLDKSCCALCEKIQDKKLSEGEKNDASRLLGLLWGVNP